MEHALGADGYNAVRGHGGITAKVIEAGFVSTGDAICYPGVVVNPDEMENKFSDQAALDLGG